MGAVKWLEFVNGSIQVILGQFPTPKQIKNVYVQRRGVSWLESARVSNEGAGGNVGGGLGRPESV